MGKTKAMKSGKFAWFGVKVATGSVLVTIWKLLEMFFWIGYSFSEKIKTRE